MAKALLEIGFIGIGGFIGAVARYLSYVGVGALTSSRFPWATIIVNVVGCFLYGAFIVWFEKIMPLPKHLFLFLSVGFLGSFTTYSTFGFETFYLFQGGRFWMGALNVVTHVVLGLGAVYLGHGLMRSFAY